MNPTTDKAPSRPAYRQKPILIVGAVMFGLIFAALAFGLVRGVGNDPNGETAASFEVAPDFTLPTFAGETFTLSENEGRPVLLVFWASWCVPCQEEAPILQRLWPEYEARGYTFVGINIVDLEKDARAFIAEYRLTFPQLRDTDGRVYLEYGVLQIAEAFFLREGRVLESRFVGGLTEAQLREHLDRIAPTGERG